MNTSLTSISQNNVSEAAGIIASGSVSLRPIAGTAYVLPLQKKINGHIKRIVDLFISILSLIVLTPLLLPILYILIKFSSKGPVFFFQERIRRNGGTFTCIKFRTMYCNPDADTLPARRHDQRITRVGWFLRKWHIDELPQLLNVFYGDMSIVGPRPHMISDTLRFEQEIPYYKFRHQVKPGLTGLAQMNGLVGPVLLSDDLRRRIEHDHYYVRHWSLWMDIKIIGKTILHILRSGPF